jgi:hypothetical protein
MGQRGAPIGHQFTRQYAVDVVERFAHGRTVSEPEHRMRRRDQTWWLRVKFTAALHDPYQHNEEVATT